MAQALADPDTAYALRQRQGNDILDQGCTNFGRQVATEFCTLAPNICGSSVWYLLHVRLLATGILRWL